MDKIQENLLEQIADIHGTPEGAYNIRANGKAGGRRTTDEIDIVTKEDKPGINIYIKAGVQNKSVHIPVVITETGLSDLVYNDFYVGEGASVVIVAGCGIHNSGDAESRHDGIHTFHLEKGAKVKYIEKHYGESAVGASGGNVMNPTTVIYQDEDSELIMETVQIRGITSTVRKTFAYLDKGASVEVREKIMTDGEQFANTEFEVEMNGDGSRANVVSRSVAKDTSKQLFISNIIGNSACTGHTECDAIIMDNATVTAEPKLVAANVDAQLIHEAAIGKIAGEQLTKLMTLGLSESEAEEMIVSGFLK